MSESKSEWPPRVGDYVQVVATGKAGVVVGTSPTRGYMVGIYSYELRSVTAAPHRPYTLRELGPMSTPPAPEPAPAPAASRRAKAQAAVS